MCGITGIYAHNLVGGLHMINMNAATKKLSHRGPDAQQTFNNQHVGLGHRRLSVIDTSIEANQPMKDISGRYIIVYNGEIYNFRELRTELEQSGIKFKTDSDTEVLLYLLIREGENALNKLNGFFAFCLYDAEEDSMLLATDRFGIKPLYYSSDENKFTFSSELASILEYGFDKKIDQNALWLYFQLNYIPAPFSLIKGIEKALPGTIIKISGTEVEVSQWYRKETKTIDTSYVKAKGHIRDLIEASVEKRMVSDVPLGTFLSGGLDSSIISYLASKHKTDINTFSIGFSDEKYFDETSYAELVAKNIGSNHQKFSLSFNDFEESLITILDGFSEPFADSSSIAYFLLSKKTKKNMTVALSGDGADEIFGGYNKYQGFLRSFDKGFTEQMASIFSPVLSVLPSSRTGMFNKFRQIQRFGKGANLKIQDRYWYWASLTQNDLLKKYLKGSEPEAVNNWKTDLTEDLLKDNDLNSVLLADQKLVLPWDMLVKSDRMSMAHGLEVRVPFLDHELVEYANSLPPEYKAVDRNGKKILRDAFPDLPSEIINRPKKGFEVPLAKWLSKALSDRQINEYFNRDLIEEQGIFNYKKIVKLKSKLRSSNPGDSHAFLWAFIVFQHFYRKYLMND